MRTCKKCLEPKPLDKEHFKLNHNKRYNKSYFETVCKSCRNKQWNEAEKKRLEDPNYLDKKRSRMSRYSKEHYANNLDYYHARNVRLKDHYAEMKRKEYGTPEYKEKERLRHKKRWANPTHRVSKLMSNKVNQMVKDKSYDSWVNCVPYTLKELMDHLEKQFRPGMSWENYGPIWHIDHIRPVSWFTFDSKDDPQFKECWALTNLQPLFKQENLAKSDRYEGGPTTL